MSDQINRMNRELTGIINDIVDAKIKANNLNTKTFKRADVAKDYNQVLTPKGMITDIQPVVTGSKGSNVALASLLSALSSLGLINNQTS